ncbi:MAG: asparagine synthase (glutamine-hydrolyzing) [Sedimentisphaerales bacterium]|nr:asparagine synthase (glutamine-hydrolyzing) [Sedimentisphaerales bacterium]
MCGIAGIVNCSIDRPDRRIVEDMIGVMRHRGPDGDGVFVDRHVALGHVRLSIIDVAGSRQPLANEDESVWVTFNGEIYNYRELREELAARGHRLRTQGDTETLVHLYEEHGPEMVHHLIGMFAFAIWDKKRRQLFMARDRMGIKPLYYCRHGNDFVFASETKAFFQHPEIPLRPSREGIWQYLTYRSVPSPATLFENIIKVRPGHLVVVTDKGVQCRAYWDIPLRPKADLSRRAESFEQMQDHVESVLTTSVKRRLISDVPLGAFLSGGVDSSLIVALMSRLTDAPVRTYSVGFRDFASSELPYAKIVADRYKTDHHELVLEEDCFADHLEKLTWIRDSPLSEPADVPLYLLSKMARRDVKVLLSGEGSDELFGGYPKYAYDRFAPLVSSLPGQMGRRIGSILPGKFRRMEVALTSLCLADRVERWAQWFSPFTTQEKSLLMPANDRWPSPTGEYVERADGAASLDAMLYTDCKLWLPDNLLDRGDRMTMGASVEGRVPFLDHELVEYAFTLPRQMKVRGFARKYVVKQIALKYLPREVVCRRKVGFRLPLAQWFRGRLRELCYDRICTKDGLMAQLLSRTQLQKVLDDHCSGRKDNWLQIWTLLGLSVWSDLFADHPVSAANHRFARATCCGS